MYLRESSAFYWTTVALITSLRGAKLRAEHLRMHMLFIPKGWCHHARKRCVEHLANLIYSAVREEELETPSLKQ